MKKSLLYLVLIATIISLMGCSNSYYQLTVEDGDDYLVESLNDKYRDGEVVDVTVGILYDVSLNIYLNGEIIDKTYSGTPNWIYQFTMPAQDSTLTFEVTNGFLVETQFTDYFEDSRYEIPNDYFTDVAFSEVTDSDYAELDGISYMILEDYLMDFKFVISEILRNENTDTNAYFALFNKTIENQSIQESFDEYHDETENGQHIYQYDQVIDGIGFLINQDSGTVTTSNYTVSGDPGFTRDFEPSNLLILNSEVDNFVYKIGTKDDITYVNISGSYDDPIRSMYGKFYNEITYLIKDNQIIAWLFIEEAGSINDTNYLRTIKYCIPFDDDLVLIEDHY